MITYGRTDKAALKYLSWNVALNHSSMRIIKLKSVAILLRKHIVIVIDLKFTTYYKMSIEKFT